MTTLSNAIFIQESEEPPTPEPGSSQLRIGARPDYSHQGFETMVNSLVDDKTDEGPSRKRKGVSRHIQQLEDRGRSFRYKLMIEPARSVDDNILWAHVLQTKYGYRT
ncbi:hypothetical protein N7509_007344 [Penicillium cosmopolitanum]|uniref:Uncharacterized protein n=1 Tax=Penicillium cosmopolitanum TaxID=1131564 RepID=A0A9W9VYQ0_9EURO|nr:uncharacterized protein N7509_007344 [Penicillium cosmopolitanum]KAJ5391854.1 hypothetical protein N7509_007344 [Penicillium cosmopolitanum]